MVLWLVGSHRFFNCHSPTFGHFHSDTNFGLLDLLLATHEQPFGSFIINTTLISYGLPKQT
jgi:hypothetical protein